MRRGLKEWYIVVTWDNGVDSPLMGPYGSTEADNLMRDARREYRSHGLKPVKMRKLMWWPHTPVQMTAYNVLIKSQKG